MRQSSRSTSESVGPGAGESKPVSGAGARRLFLDDDPKRAEIFLADYPDGVWVQTAADCIARLAERWDEVHLDHDLGGEMFVDHARDDCGMEVVRWLCLARRVHLRYTQFYIHSHNPHAATTMGLQLMNAGYTVELRPFGAPPLPPLPDDGPPPDAGFVGRVLYRIKEWFLGPRDQSKEYGYTNFDRTAAPVAGEPPPPVEKLDLSWTRPGSTLPRGTPKAADLPQPVEKLDLSWGKPQVPPTAPRAAPAPPAPTLPTSPAPPPRPEDDDVAYDPY
ncbi:MAG: cyclic-phosphate processing receiver domain-containing protein [Isosphaeraceae bacterium]